MHLQRRLLHCLTSLFCFNPLRDRRRLLRLLLVFGLLFLWFHISFRNSRSSRPDIYDAFTDSFPPTSPDEVDDTTPLPQYNSICDLVPDPNGYVLYLPHSGFHMQRTALENAIMVGRILNRTVVVPPVFLGMEGEMPWKPFDALWEVVERVERVYGAVVVDDKGREWGGRVECDSKKKKKRDGKEKLQLVKRAFGFLSPSSPPPLPAKPKSSKKSPTMQDRKVYLHPSKAILPWSALFNMTRLSTQSKLISFDAFLHLVHHTIPSIIKSPNDIMFIKDSERYSYKLVDPSSSVSAVVETKFVDGSTDDLRTITKGQSLRGTKFVIEVEDASPDSSSHKYQLTAHFLPLNTTSSPLKSFPPRLITSSTPPPPFSLSMGPYAHILNLRSPLLTKHPLLFFGSLFGHTRLALSDQTQLEKIRNEIIPSNPILEQVCQMVVYRMGGPGRFLGVVVVGEGESVKGKVQGLVAKVVKEVAGVTGEAGRVDRARGEGTFMPFKGRPLPIFLTSPDSPSSLSPSFLKTLLASSTLSHLVDPYTSLSFPDLLVLLFSSLSQFRYEATKTFPNEWTAKFTGWDPFTKSKKEDQEGLPPLASPYSSPFSSVVEILESSVWIRVFVSVMEQMVLAQAGKVVVVKPDERNEVKQEENVSEKDGGSDGVTVSGIISLNGGTANGSSDKSEEAGGEGADNDDVDEQNDGSNSSNNNDKLDLSGSKIPPPKLPDPTKIPRPTDSTASSGTLTPIQNGISSSALNTITSYYAAYLSRLRKTFWKRLVVDEGKVGVEWV